MPFDCLFATTTHPSASTSFANPGIVESLSVQAGEPRIISQGMANVLLESLTPAFHSFNSDLTRVYTVGVSSGFLSLIVFICVDCTVPARHVGSQGPRMLDYRCTD